jgi:MATE family multidrug resistance protein
MMGKAELTATNLAFNLNSLVFVPMLGLGTAIMTITGQRVGEERPDLAVQTAWKGFVLASGYVVALAAIYLLLPELILWPYTVGAAPAAFITLKQQVITLLRFVAVYSIFDAMAVVFGAAIRGAGDTQFVLGFQIVCAVFVLVLPSYFAYAWWNAGIDAAWTIITVFIAVMGMGLMLRFLLGPWKQMRVIEPVSE